MIFRHVYLWVFTLLLVMLSAADAFGPLRVFSAMENRYLAQRPAFDWADLLQGRYAADFEAYVDDQFVGREAWMRGKALAESLLGKTENNGIVFGRDGWLFRKFIALPAQYEKNLKALESFARLYSGLPMQFLMAPNADAVLRDKVPAGLYNLDQQVLIEEAFSLLSKADLVGVNVLEALRASSEPYLYYRLDHHWTTNGAYAAYEAWCLTKGLKPVRPDASLLHRVPDFRGTFFSAAKRFDGAADEILYYDMPYATAWIDGVKKDSLYDLSHAGGKDKYSLFLHGNPGRMTLQSTHPDAADRTLLVFKDSYANSFLPFLTAHFRTIEVIDLRHYNGKVSDLMAEGACDEVLLLYSVSNFAEEKSVLKLAMQD